MKQNLDGEVCVGGEKCGSWWQLARKSQTAPCRQRPLGAANEPLVRFLPLSPSQSACNSQLTNRLNLPTFNSINGNFIERNSSEISVMYAREWEGMNYVAGRWSNEWKRFI